MEKQVTLDVVALAELRKAVEELKERVLKIEIDLGVIESGYDAVYNALEVNVLMSAGEPSSPVARPEAKGESWDPGKIPWIDAAGGKGPYQKSEDINNPEFKAILKDLGAHKGKLYKNGLFYWAFPSGATVGRKRVRKGR